MKPIIKNDKTFRVVSAIISVTTCSMFTAHAIYELPYYASSAISSWFAVLSFFMAFYTIGSIQQTDIKEHISSIGSHPSAVTDSPRDVDIEFALWCQDWITEQTEIHGPIRFELEEFRRLYRIFLIDKSREGISITIIKKPHEKY